MSAKQPNPPPGEPGYTGPPQAKPEPPPAPPPIVMGGWVGGVPGKPILESPTPPDDTYGLLGKSLPPSPPLNRVFRNYTEEKPSTVEGIRLVSNGETYGIQHRKRFLWWTWWRTIHTDLALEEARSHVLRVRAEITERRAKAGRKWYPVTMDGKPLPMWCDTDGYHDRGYPGMPSAGTPRRTE